MARPPHKPLFVTPQELEHYRGFVEAFVVARKRERCLASQHEFCSRLCGANQIVDMRVATTIPHSATSEDVIEALRGLTHLDRAIYLGLPYPGEYALAEAVKLVDAGSSAASIIPGRLAYVRGENRECGRFILRR